MFAIWIVIGVLAGVLADRLWKGYRPFGEAADYGVALVVAVLTGLVDWYLLPLWFGVQGGLRFAAAVVEPSAAALIALWVMRLLRKQ
jgi:uncharacterized membrane protein YeaQ/YmgE (transglycosylase-associated protein family)